MIDRETMVAAFGPDPSLWPTQENVKPEKEKEKKTRWSSEELAIWREIVKTGKALVKRLGHDVVFVCYEKGAIE